jgi:hypothetical protein
MRYYFKTEYYAKEHKNDGKKPASINQLNRQIEKGQAPQEVARVDNAHINGTKSHIHLKDGRAYNLDGQGYNEEEYKYEFRDKCYHEELETIKNNCSSLMKYFLDNFTFHDAYLLEMKKSDDKLIWDILLLVAINKNDTGFCRADVIFDGFKEEYSFYPKVDSKRYIFEFGDNEFFFNEAKSFYEFYFRAAAQGYPPIPIIEYELVFTDMAIMITQNIITDDDNEVLFAGKEKII